MHLIQQSGGREKNNKVIHQPGIQFLKRKCEQMLEIRAKKVELEEL